MNQAKPAIGRRERKREATRGQIMVAAMALFEEQDYEDVTIDAITERADVAKGTFYLHFRAKEDLASEAYNGFIRPAAEEIARSISTECSAIELIAELFRAAAIPAAANPRLARAVFSHGMSQAYAKPRTSENPGASFFSAVLEKVIVHGQERGELRSDLQSWELTVMLSVLFATTVWMWASEPSSENLDDRLGRCIKVCLEGIAVSK